MTDNKVRVVEGVRLGREAQDRRASRPNTEADEKASYWDRVKRLSSEEKRA